MKKKRISPSISHDEALVEELKNNPRLAEEFLRVALAEAGEEGGDYLLQKTLRLVAEARGMAKVAKLAGIPRESLSRALSARGNPRLSTLQAVTSALGLHLTVSPRI
jgi:probable addiction module antidote protein